MWWKQYETSYRNNSFIPKIFKISLSQNAVENNNNNKISFDGNKKSGGNVNYFQKKKRKKKEKLQALKS